jgi:hypothetical protein
MFVRSNMTTEARRDSRQGWCVIAREYQPAKHFPGEALV